MKEYCILYENKLAFDRFIQKNKLDPEREYFVCIHTAIYNETTAVTVAGNIKSVLPKAQIIGTSTNCLIYKGDIIEDACLVIIFSFDKAGSFVRMIPYADKSVEQLVDTLEQEIGDVPVQALFTFFPDGYFRVCDFLDCFNERFSGVRMIGGLASPSAVTGESFIFDETGVKENTVAVGVIYGAELKCYSGILTGHEALGEVYTITKTKDDYIDEIDEVPCVDWMKEYLGVQEFVENGYREGAAEVDILLKFPLVLEGFSAASRFLQYEKETSRMKLYNDHMREGQKFRLGYLSPMTTADECRHFCKELQKQTSEVIVSYSCVFRKTFVNNCATWEMQPFQNCSICGAFLHGEIGYKQNKNEFLNGSNSFLTLAESQKQLPIDMSAFDKMYQIEDDRKDLYNYVLKKQSETMFKKNAKLLEQIVVQEEITRNKLFLDMDTGIENLGKYSYDYVLECYNKMCMISISKGPVLLSHLGEKNVGKILRDLIGLIQQKIGEKPINIYKHNSCSFFLVAGSKMSQEEFQRFMRELYQTYDKMVVKELGVTMILNYALVVSERSLLEKARYTSFEAESSSVRYLVYDEHNQKESNISSTLRMVTIISEALANDGIIPYFQPIYDNKNHTFNKVEALMRIVDSDGNIYNPMQFMDIAKEYNIYLEISQHMLMKVFDLFEFRKEEVSLNISAYDVSEKSMRNAIYERLQRMTPENRSHFIFEVLESEEYRDQQILKNFIQEVRNLGAKISIDDFGSGYSNLLEIVSLEADYIKIDGELIKELTKDERKQIIVDTIVYMAKRFGVELIAEMVENEEIQAEIEKKGIAYTQGYYFAKPMDYTHLEEFLEKN